MQEPTGAEKIFGVKGRKTSSNEFDFAILESSVPCATLMRQHFIKCKENLEFIQGDTTG